MDWGYEKGTGLRATRPRDPIDSAGRAREGRARASDLSHYTDLLESLGDAILVSDAGGWIVFLNAEAERIFGYDRTEAIGCPLTMLLPTHPMGAGEHQGATHSGRDLLFRPTPRRLEIRGLRKDGRAFDAEVALSQMEVGRKHLFTAVVRDVSSQKKLEGALRESERLLRRSQEVAGVGSWAWEWKTGRQVWSDEFYRLLGLRPGEIAPTYENYLSFTHPDDRTKYCGPDLEAWVRRLQAGRTYPDQHVRIIRADGAVRWMRRWFGVDTDADGTITGATGTLQDVTEQRAAAERLRDSERLLKRAQQLSRIGSWEYDLETNRAAWSDEMYEILGLKPRPTGPTRDDLARMVHPADLDLHHQHYNTAIAERLPSRSFDMRVIRADGALRVFHVSLELDWGSGDYPRKVTGTAQDITEQRAAAERLKVSEQRLKRAQHIAMISSWARDMVTGELTWSDQMSKLLGPVPDGQTVGPDEVRSRLHPADRKLVDEQFKDALARRLTEQSFDVRSTAWDGSERVFRLNYEYDWGDGDRLLRLAGTAQDITEDTKAAERLALSEKRLRRAQEIARIGSWELNAQGEHSWTDELFRIYGFEPGSVSPDVELFESLVDPDDRAFLQRAMEEARAQRLKDRTVDVRITRPDGVERIINQHVEFSWSPDGALLSMAGTSQDVTELRLATERLRHSERLLQRAQQLSRIGSWEFDIKTGQVNWSDHLFEIFGLDRRTTVPTQETFLGMVYPDDREMNVRRYEEAVSDRLATQSFDTRIVRADGEVRVLHALYEFDWDDGDAPSKVTGTGQDVTEERAAREALQQALQAAEEANRAKSAFLANMSHELRTPLNAIIGFSELIRSTGQMPRLLDKVPEYADYIHSSGTHLLEIICEILDLSRVEAGSLTLAEEEIAIADLVDWATNMIRPQAQTACVSVQRDLPAAPLAIVGDRRLMRESLLNLLSNAVKFTPKGGRVQVSARTETGGDLIIAVCDSGIGMRAEDIPAALSPFTQLESTLTRRYEGTGLGLPLTKKFVELHGGKLEIESAPGQGTCVSLTIPAERCRRL